MARLDGYVAELEYVHHFCKEFGPAALNLVLTWQGAEPISLDHGFTCCDLGCGQGLSTNIFAACHPGGHFHGIDFNQAHILGARGLAAQAGLANVTFWEASFDDLGTLPLPEFDFITLHGVFSWVNSENRKYIIDFIRRKLKIGGVVYVSYNCLPGWSAIAPVRQLLISHAYIEPGSLEEQINCSIKAVERLKSLDLSCFTRNPAAGSFFDFISKLPANYLAHEFFNDNWVPFYHADVAKDLAPADMVFVGSANFADNLDFLRFSVEEQQLLNDIENPVLKETLKDFAANQQFRKDVFTKGRNNLAQPVHLELVSRCRFALVVPRVEVTMTANFPRGEAQLDPEVHETVLYALEERHHSLDELLLKPHIALLGPGKVRQALEVFVSLGTIMPAIDPSPQAVASARAFNYTILERTAFNRQPQPLASPVVQSGVQLDWIQRLLLLCELTESGDPLAFASNVIREDHALREDGAALQSLDEKLEELGQRIRKFYDHQLPLLKRLEVVG